METLTASAGAALPLPITDSLNLRVFKRNAANLRQPISSVGDALAGTARTASARQYGL
jgi:hypothetical protein